MSLAVPKLQVLESSIQSMGSARKVARETGPAIASILGYGALLEKQCRRTIYDQITWQPDPLLQPMARLRCSPVQPHGALQRGADQRAAQPEETHANGWAQRPLVVVGLHLSRASCPMIHGMGSSAQDRTAWQGSLPLQHPPV